MSIDEAKQILNLNDSKAAPSLEDVLKQHDKYFQANDPSKGGSLYLQSKVLRAKEVLEEELKAPPADASSAKPADGKGGATAASASPFARKAAGGSSQQPRR